MRNNRRNRIKQVWLVIVAFLVLLFIYSKFTADIPQHADPAGFSISESEVQTMGEVDSLLNDLIESLDEFKDL